MRKFFYSLCALLLGGAMAANAYEVTSQLDVMPMNPMQNAQLQSAPQHINEANLEWLSYSSRSTEKMGGVGADDGVELEVAALYPKSVLEDYVGKQIQLIEVGLWAPVGEATVFIKKGNSYNSAETVVEKTVPALAAGWNYILLDEPYEIDGETSLSIGYSIVDNGQYPIAFDGYKLKAQSKNQILKCNGQGQTLQASWGNIMVGGLVGGDVEELANIMGVIELKSPSMLPINTAADIELTLLNGSYKPLSSYTIAYTENGGDVQTIDVTLDAPLAPACTTTYTYTTAPLQESYTIDMGVTKVDGNDVQAVTTMSAAIRVYDPENVVIRNSVIEKYTGQTCTFCPGGEQSILAAIAGLSSADQQRIVRVDHHAGYQDDSFTIQGSKTLCSYFGVTGAPSSTLDRTTQSLRTGASAGVVFHPGYLTPAILQEALDIFAYVSVDVTADYNPETRMVDVKVSGHRTVSDVDGAYLTLIMTMSGVHASQTSGGSNWIHNDFPIEFLSEVKGDAIEFTDNKYEMTYSYKLPENVGKNGVYTTTPETVRAVAIVSRMNGKNDSEALNSNWTKLNIPSVDGISGVDSEAGLGLFVVGGQLYCTVEGAQVTVVDITGRSIDYSKGLRPGMYVATAIHNGKKVTRKLQVR